MHLRRNRPRRAGGRLTAEADNLAWLATLDRTWGRPMQFAQFQPQFAGSIARPILGGQPWEIRYSADAGGLMARSINRREPSQPRTKPVKTLDLLHAAAARDLLGRLLAAHPELRGGAVSS